MLPKMSETLSITNIANNSEIQILEFPNNSKIWISELLPIFVIESVAGIFGNIVGLFFPKKLYLRGLSKFCKVFAEIKSLKVGSKMDFSCFMMKFHPKFILRDETKILTPRGDFFGHFGLILGFTPNWRGSHQKEIFDQTHPHPCQTEKSKEQISAKNRQNKI